MDISLAEAAMAFLVIAVGSAVQGAVGFGAALIAAPILVLIEPRLVPGPVLMSMIVLVALMLAREHRHVDVPGLGWALTGRIPGTALALATMAVLPERGLVLGVGIVVLLGVAMSASGLHFRPTPRTLVGAGLMAGFMGTSTSIGGPPMALTYQASVGSELRGSLSGHFLIGASISLGALVLGGHIGWPELVGSALLVPGTVAGFLVSLRLAPVIDRGYTRHAILSLSAFAGAVVIVKELL